MKNLENLRQQIDVLDNQLLTVLQKRLKAVEEIGRLKKQLNLPALQPKRWRQVIDSRVKIAQKLGINKDFITKIFDLIHTEALKIEEET